MTEGIKFVNLTPHQINIVNEKGEIILSIPPSGKVARVTARPVKVGEISGIPINKVEYGDIEGLPEPQKGVIYIVSILVLQALKSKGIQRNDVLAPDTNPYSVVRDEQGRIIGVKAFMVL